ncbi:MAG: GTPase ObgE [Victivallaceae bacterium]|jgi:GTP-binding protein
MFVDKAKISVKAGDGGDGCCSFRREKYVPRGGPSGGDGGHGGSVILQTSANEQSLVDLVFQRHYQAKSGENGRGKDQYGKKGENIIIPVPIGTVVKNVENGEVIVDMDHADMNFVIAAGGQGGRGNIHFSTSTNRAPRECTPGQPGEELKIELELKTIADIGLVGYPNAGKSTLLRAVSHARPKVAPYPFTTLHPVVGMVEFPDYFKMSMADIPGLIEGAHDNVGLGHSFLKHIERTHVLVYVLDTAGVDERNPWEDFEHLQNELELYMKGLSSRPAIIVANKMDLPESLENLEMLKESLSSSCLEIIPVSAEKSENISFLVARLRELVEKYR